ncbi:hypothetical protein SMD44_00997 [Streptomyces alboflavus]|uniref:Uncharacterized protein n=1 Tax=Streptomyces alboflavus TaxID=67267 RepID=A0A1Z1W5F3_9ACTN|nr:hypothetical protein [Streptomyces alboflavus]ARX81599.1 hypothetical protein SMD44_00997 [Streptomyces alboflavus]
MSDEHLLRKIDELERVVAGLMDDLTAERQRTADLRQALGLQGTLLGISRALDEGFERSLFSRLQLGRHEGDTP